MALESYPLPTQKFGMLTDDEITHHHPHHHTVSLCQFRDIFLKKADMV